MPLDFEELDCAWTRFGELVLRKRRVRSMDDATVYEVKLGGDFLMSSVVNDSEIALTELGLAALPADLSGRDVVVGGLGLGYTAVTALDDPTVGSLLVVEALPEVLSWHERGLVPEGPRLTGDPRCRLVQGDFFALARGDEGLDPEQPGRRFHAILVDIDHSPGGLLHPSHEDLYTEDGLRRLTRWLHPGGVFALWSFEPPEDAVTERLRAVFAGAEAHAVEFHNPLLDRDDLNTIYVATT